jgi:hypothetical protein
VLPGSTLPVDGIKGVLKQEANVTRLTSHQMTSRTGIAFLHVSTNRDVS